MTCDHPKCLCPPQGIERDGRRFCSESCANAGSETATPGGCACGHPGCGQAAREHHASDRP